MKDLKSFLAGFVADGVEVEFVLLKGERRLQTTAIPFGEADVRDKYGNGTFRIRVRTRKKGAGNPWIHGASQRVVISAEVK